MKLIGAIHVSFEFCRGVCSKKMLMLSMGSSLLKTQVMSLRLIITDLSSGPKIIFSLLWVFSPHHLTATSLHFLSMLHTKWASNESCLPKNTMNLRIFGGLRNTLHIPGHQGCHCWEWSVAFKLCLGDEVLSQWISPMQFVGKIQ
jgi:hypothetical protein